MPPALSSSAANDAAFVQCNVKCFDGVLNIDIVSRQPGILQERSDLAPIGERSRAQLNFVGEHGGPSLRSIIGATRKAHDALHDFIVSFVTSFVLSPPEVRREISTAPKQKNIAR
ncbi:hypothetical protein [Ralstonia mannitolilytica]|uniref:hypothetical protein n=1 Tax=Ralstonia mannitolilytica TaxID=105219 RepID=UPI00292CE72E|nr:hypothetical protein [Ralstonia mannitolilytica]